MIAWLKKKIKAQDTEEWEEKCGEKIVSLWKRFKKI